MTDALWAWSAGKLAHGIRTGKISSREATESAFARMDAVNPDINAVVMPMREQALKEADQADQAVREGKPLGVLHGVPVTIKMNVDVAGMPRTNGLKIYADRVATDDSPVVTNLRLAGAVTVGLTNCPAFAARSATSNEMYGVTFNPWNPEVCCGGSSGGAASAVAAGIGAVAHGNDLGGSVRSPAYHCGVFGLKVTPNRIPNYNPSVTGDRPSIHQATTSQGPLARTMSGIRLGFSAMARQDARDPWWVPGLPPADRVQGPCEVALFEAPDSAEPVVNQNLNKVAGWLEDAGYRVKRVAPPRFEETFVLHTALLNAEREDSTLKDILRVGDEYVRRSMTTRVAVTQPEPLKSRTQYMDAVAMRTTILREWMLFFQRYPLLVMPDMFVHKLAHEFDQQGEEVMARAQWAMIPHRVISCLSLPALSAPCGVIDGAPIGAQLVAARFQDEFLMDVGDVIQARNGMGAPVTPFGKPASASALRG